MRPFVTFCNDVRMVVRRRGGRRHRRSVVFVVFFNASGCCAESKPLQRRLYALGRHLCYTLRDLHEFEALRFSLFYAIRCALLLRWHNDKNKIGNFCFVKHFIGNFIGKTLLMANVSALVLEKG